MAIPRIKKAAITQNMYRLPLPFVALCGFWLIASLAGCSVTGPSLDEGGERRDSAIPTQRVIVPFEVIASDGTPYEHPFLGGMNVPRPQLVDIDGDGDMDLFVQEYTGAVTFFENTGSARSAEYTWRSDRYEGLDVGEWYRFADIDGDGRIDLLAEQPFSYIRYYRNVGTPTDPSFVAAADTLRDVNGDPIFSDRQNIPNVTDIDCDGLADLFIGRLDGTVTRYEAVDSTTVPVFRLVTERFEDIEIVAQFGQPGNANPAPMPNIPATDPGIRGPSVGPDHRTDVAAPTLSMARESTRGLRSPSTGPLHGANTMTFGDIDGDGDQDLFWGDFFEPGLLRIENRGSCRNPDLSGEPVPFPPPEPIQSSGYNAPTLGDLDGDGDMDLLIGVLGGAFNPNRTAADNLYFYEQLDDGHFELRTRRFLDQIDVGSESYPVLVDLDGDGDDDLLVANKISSQDSRTSVLAWFENVSGAAGSGGGTGDISASGRFEMRDSIALMTAYHYAPAFGDLFGDGNLDMLLGTWNDGVALYRNDGTAEPSFELVEAGFVELTRGSHTTPALVDIDGDGDLDLFVGETSGTVNFYENTGSATSPEFTLVSDEYAGINVGRRSAPTFLDVDGDGDMDMIVGSESNGLILYRNGGTPSTPHFDRGEPLPMDVPPVAVPTFGDADGDGVIEMIVGGLGGGLYYFDTP